MEHADGDGLCNGELDHDSDGLCDGVYDADGDGLCNGELDHDGDRLSNGVHDPDGDWLCDGVHDADGDRNWDGIHDELCQQYVNRDGNQHSNGHAARNLEPRSVDHEYPGCERKLHPDGHRYYGLTRVPGAGSR
jgi:hypothetical protein